MPWTRPLLTHFHNCTHTYSIIFIIIIYAFNSAICRRVHININLNLHTAIARSRFLHLSQFHSFALSSWSVVFRLNMFPFEFYALYSSRRLDSISQKFKKKKTHTHIHTLNSQQSFFCFFFFYFFQCEKIEISATVVTLLPYPYICCGILCGECLLCLLFVYALTSFCSYV